MEWSKGIPWAVLVAAVGTVWQLVYALIRDRARDKEVENQKALELIRFEYEKRRWREQFTTQLALKHVDARLTEYALLWSYVRLAARHNLGKSLTPEVARTTATEVETWRYSVGGLLAEEITRDAALAFQTALWHYDGSKEAYHRIREARRLLRAALRCDLGLGKDSTGQSMLVQMEERQNIQQEITEFQRTLEPASTR